LYPPLFERVKEKVLEGKFQPVGGSWVENDANMPSGEGLARQFIFGQRYFLSRFGKRCETAWLPDSFGLTGALPQLIRLSGMNYFFTQKLSWCVSFLCLYNDWLTTFLGITCRFNYSNLFGILLYFCLATFSPIPHLIGLGLMELRFCAI
jgi:Glycosyl hydrolases family 38 N-terminal domain